MEQQTHDTAPEGVQENVEPVEAPGIGLLDRPRPERPPLIPRWIPVTIIAVVAVIAVGIGVAVFVSRGGAVVVPRVVGIDSGVARTRLAQQGLELTIAEERFSSLPEGTVIEQRPAPGTEIQNGETVTVVVSAGSEDFAMPDLVGAGLAFARGQLEDKGLEIRVVAEPSDQTSDTVLATSPAAGSSMRTGDVVTLTVSTPGVGGDVLLPTSMQGVVVTLDPAPVAAGRPDVPLEVARRVRSLLEASGATVYATRALADTGTAVSEEVRRKRAVEGPPNVSIGLDAPLRGTAGMVAAAPASGPDAAQSATLASEIASALAASGLTAKSSTETTDKVLGGTAAPFSRLRLGTFGAREDVAHFNDPSWADRVSRAIYRALALGYGSKEPTP